MKQYVIKIRRYNRGKLGTTIYRFPLRIVAISFAGGYKSALKDVGYSNLYISVHDEKGAKVYEA